jgi:hypothetical protein
MKYLLITLCMTFALASAEPPKASPKPPDGIPAGAVAAGDNTWRHTDSNGKTWLYVQTPFGFNRMEEKPKTSSSEQDRSKDKAAAPAFRVASVKDGLVTFERDTPFGKNKWTKKRAEMSADEQAAVAAFESAAPPARK